MTTSGLELVRRYRELVASGRFEEALPLLSDDLEFFAPDGSLLTFTDIKELWSKPPQEYDHLTLELTPTGLHEVGPERYLGETDYVYRWKEDGEISNVEHRAMLFELESGKIQRMKFFVDPRQAWAEAEVVRA